jgi:hypothetical protein
MDNLNLEQDQLVMPHENKQTLPLVPISLVVLLLMGGSLSIGYLLGQKSVITSQPTLSQNDVATPAPLSDATDLALDPVIEMPPITERTKRPNTTGWKFFADSQGYSVKIPPNWHFSTSDGSVLNTIKNWVQNENDKPGPLSEDQSKWDVNFRKKNFSGIEELLPETTDKQIIIEKSQTNSGLLVYFVQTTGSFFGNEDVRVPILRAFIIDGSEFFAWSGIYSGKPEHAETLKQIVESIDK